MILALLIILPLAAGPLAWLTGRWSRSAPRWISLAAMALDLALAVALWIHGPMETSWGWIPQLGIGFTLSLDGLSILMVALTAFLGVIAVAASWKEIKDRVGFFHFNLMWTLAGITGVFLASDLLLFYFFWELMLVPMYFLFLWGQEKRSAAGMKFLIYTQSSGLLMLLAILVLYFMHAGATGVYTFDYAALLQTPAAGPAANMLMFGFFIAFAVKMGVPPFHGWLPDAYTHAPTAGTLLLAGLMAKTGAYGLLRFVLPLFPEQALQFAPMGMALGAAAILYGGLMAFSQTDLKRMVAYTSISHMGFVLLGIFAPTAQSQQGAVILMLGHGAATGALFVMAGALQERLGTRELGRMGGLWETAPRMGGTMLFLALALMGLPGTANFIGEFLVLVGAWRTSIPLATVAALGMILSVIYALWMIQRVFQGPNRENWKFPDFSLRETVAAAAMIGVVLWIGLYPKPISTAAGPVLDRTMPRADLSAQDEGGEP